jgi:hypothetical protein
VFILEHYFATKSFAAVREHTVANIDPETLRKVARNTLKRVDAFFQKVVDIFSIRCVAVL